MVKVKYFQFDRPTYARGVVTHWFCFVCGHDDGTSGFFVVRRVRQSLRGIRKTKIIINPLARAENHSGNLYAVQIPNGDSNDYNNDKLNSYRFYKTNSTKFKCSTAHCKIVFVFL